MKSKLHVILFFCIIGALLYITKDYWEGWIFGVVSILFSLSAYFIAIVIFLENRHPSKTVTWLLVLAIFPIIGFFFYIMFGINHRKMKSYTEKAIMDEQALHKIEGNKPLNEKEIAKMGEDQQLLFRLAHRLGNNPISYSTETKILTDGKETFAYILATLKNATNHIHMEYYIVRSDEIGNEIKDVLIEKVNQGVHVRFLYDAVGCFQLAKSYVQQLKDAGVEMVAFSPVRFPLLNHKINFRNHRKIIVVDAQVGFVGGLNIGDEYLGKNKYFGHWRDTHLYVQGEAVRSLQLIFLRDWYYMTNF